MNAVAFDTLKAASRLREAGFEERQANELVSTFAESLTDELATKNDIAALEQRMTIKLGGMIMAAAGFLVVADKLL